MRFQQALSGKDGSHATGKLRTVEHLLTAAETYAENRKRNLAEQEARKRALRARAEAIAREKYLDTLVGREKRIWVKVENLVTTRQPAKYDEAVKLLIDLRDLSKKKNTIKTYYEKLKQIREKHIRKSTFLSRLKKADLEI